MTAINDAAGVSEGLSSPNNNQHGAHYETHETMTEAERRASGKVSGDDDKENRS